MQHRTPDPQDLSPAKAARRQRILDAAGQVFLRHGFRGATMEAIAEAASLSKVTLYSYFRDKDAVFDAVVARMFAEIRAAFLTALAASGSLRSRVAGALLAKHGMVFDTVGSSPFAAELLEKRPPVADRARLLDRELTEALAVALGDAQAARVLFDGAMGIAHAAADRHALAADITRLVAALVAG